MKKIPLAIRYAIQTAPANQNTAALMRRFGLTRQSITRWRKRASIMDLHKAPKNHGRRKLNQEDIILICGLRILWGYPLDTLRERALPHLSAPVSRQQISNILSQHNLTDSYVRVEERKSGRVRFSQFKIDSGKDGVWKVLGAINLKNNQQITQTYRDNDQNAYADFLEKSPKGITFKKIKKTEKNLHIFSFQKDSAKDIVHILTF